mmetsp:Transcript_9583/g.29695  ORF Transcript_9583/g.29695 Transcript_9583/m.29695 type:complete len:299 (+) Transcript_9583:73-969(+)
MRRPRAGAKSPGPAAPAAVQDYLLLDIVVPKGGCGRGSDPTGKPPGKPGVRPGWPGPGGARDPGGIVAVGGSVPMGGMQPMGGAVAGAREPAAGREPGGRREPPGDRVPIGGCRDVGERVPMGGCKAVGERVPMGGCKEAVGDRVPMACMVPAGGREPMGGREPAYGGPAMCSPAVAGGGPAGGAEAWCAMATGGCAMLAECSPPAMGGIVAAWVAGLIRGIWLEPDAGPPKLKSDPPEPAGSEFTEPRQGEPARRALLCGGWDGRPSRASSEITGTTSLCGPAAASLVLLAEARHSA